MSLVARSISFTAIFYLGTLLCLVVASPLLLGPRSWAMAALRGHARASLWALKMISGTHLVVRGLENLPKAPYLVAAKHQSTWDTFALIPLFRDPALVMKAELGLIPLYGWFSVKFGHILVRRGRAAVALKSLIKDARDRAAAGREILIFPEGTRRLPGAHPDYKPGIVALYEGLELPCVPIALNSGLFWPRRQLVRYPGTIIVEILPALPAGLGRAAFKSQLQSAVEIASARLIEEAARASPWLPTPGFNRRDTGISGIEQKKNIC